MVLAPDGSVRWLRVFGEGSPFDLFGGVNGDEPSTFVVGRAYASFALDGTIVPQGPFVARFDEQGSAVAVTALAGLDNCKLVDVHAAPGGRLSVSATCPEPHITLHAATGELLHDWVVGLPSRHVLDWAFDESLRPVVTGADWNTLDGASQSQGFVAALASIEGS